LPEPQHPDQPDQPAPSGRPDEPGEPRVADVEEATVALIRERVPMDGLPDFFDRAFHVLGEAAAQGRLTIVGPPVGVYFGMPTDTVDVGVGFPVTGEVQGGVDVVVETLPAGPAASVVHAGSYDSMEQTYARLTHWVEDQGLAPGPVMWETYLTEPTPEADPADMRTLITWPVTPPQG
jgi:effector-binding domain-containing protein